MGFTENWTIKRRVLIQSPKYTHDESIPISVIGDGVCSGVYSIEECGYESGDCDHGQYGQELIISGVAAYYNGNMEFENYGVDLSLDGRRLAIGSPYSDENGNTDYYLSEGVIKIYEYDLGRKRWIQLGKDIIGEGDGDFFGLNMVLSFDGSRVAISAHWNDGVNSTDTGHVRVFDFDEVKKEWIQVGQDIDGEVAHDYSGHKIDMTADGTRLAIAAPWNDAGFDNDEYESGHIRVYELDSSSSDPASQRWVQLGNDIDGLQYCDYFGYWSLALSSSSGDRLIFSGGDEKDEGGEYILVFEFNETSLEWTQLGEQFSAIFSKSSVISADGSRVAFGTSKCGIDFPGEVQVYDFDATIKEWIQVGDTILATTERSDGFGYSMAMSSDGDLLAIGSKSLEKDWCGDDWCATGTVRLYRYDPFSQQWVQLGPDIIGKGDGDEDVGYEDYEGYDDNNDDGDDVFGINLSLSADGSLLTIGSYNRTDHQGFVKVYNVTNLSCPYYRNNPNFNNTLCNGGYFNSKGCNHDSGDCDAFNSQYPNCPIEYLASKHGVLFIGAETIFGDGICNSVLYSMKECGYEGGDCNQGQVSQDIIMEEVQDSIFSVGMNTDGNRFVVGSPVAREEISRKHKNRGRLGMTAVYEFNPTRQGWVQAGGVIRGRTGKAEENHFGEQVAISSDGNRIVASARGGVRVIPKVGIVRVFDFDEVDEEWTQVGPDINTGHYVTSISMTADGSRVVISEWFYEDAEKNYGPLSRRIRVYDFDSFDQSKRWIQLGQDIHYQDISYQHLIIAGEDSVAISSSAGNRLLITGSVRSRVYEIKSTNGAIQEWAQLGQDLTIAKGPCAISSDGSRVALSSDGSSVALGGEVSVYDLNATANEWIQIGQTVKSPAGAYEYSMDMSSDGTRLAIGASEEKSGGVVRLYRYDPFSQQWLQVSNDIIDSGEGAYQSVFGGGLSLSADGSRLGISGHTLPNNEAFVKIYSVEELILIRFNTLYPDCHVLYPSLIGDGNCNGGEYNTAACDWDGGDCAEFNTNYPDCHVPYPSWVGDGVCHAGFGGEIYSAACGWDGGDCAISRYPDCDVPYPSWVGDGICNEVYNTTACGWDGGDCIV
jgi:hypothetical protein